MWSQMSYHRCSLVLIGPEICWETNNSGYYPRNFKTNPPILRNSMKIIDVSILENPIFCKWRLFPGNDIITDQKHWKNHCRFSGNDFFNVLKFTPFTSEPKYWLITILALEKTPFIINLSIFSAQFHEKTCLITCWLHVESL